MTATEAMQAEGGEKGKRSDAALNEAQEFLEQRLRDGPVKSTELKDDADQLGISWRTIERAKRGRGIVSRKEGKDWVFELPMHDHTETTDALFEKGK
jgi:putative DNA primase/helicase